MTTPAGTSLCPREAEALERLIALLEREYGSALRAIWLYGSRARGEPPRDEDSDVDLLIILEGATPEAQRRATELAWEAAEQHWGLAMSLSVAVRSPEWIDGRREIRSFFMQEVDRDRIVLLERA